MEPHERRKKERQARVNQIIDAARAVFYKKSFDQATMADIERESSLTRGAIYYHFKGGKEEIYLTLIIEEEKDLLEQFRAIAAGEKDPVRGIKTLMETYMEAFILWPNPWKMHQLYWFIGYPDPKVLNRELLDDFNRVTHNLIEILAGYISQGVRAGTFQCNDPVLESMMIWSLFTNAVHVTTDNPRIPFAAADWPHMRKALMERVWRLIRPDFKMTT